MLTFIFWLISSNLNFKAGMLDFYPKLAEQHSSLLFFNPFLFIPFHALRFLILFAVKWILLFELLVGT